MLPNGAAIGNIAERAPLGLAHSEFAANLPKTPLKQIVQSDAPRIARRRHEDSALPSDWLLL